MQAPKHILIAGGSGMIGTRLKGFFRQLGMEVSVLSRNPSLPGEYKWDPEKGTIDPQAFEKAEVLLNLAGAGIADKRWSSERKWEIVQSRSRSADAIYMYLKSHETRIHTVVSASATGFYGNTGNRLAEEGDHPGSDFLGNTCVQWEASAKRVEELGLRLVVLRIGFVLAREGGAWPVLKKQVNLFAGAPFGSGEQFISWIHIEDLCRVFEKAVTDANMRGIYNAVAPQPVTNREFMKTAGRVLRRPVWPFAVPGFVLRTLLGEKAEMVLGGQRVSEEKLREQGFVFHYTDLKPALASLT